MFNFLNLFEERETKKIIDPFMGNGIIAMFATLQDFDIYGSDIDEKKVQNTIRNLDWLLNDIEEAITPFFINKFKKIDVKNLLDYYDPQLFDGICTEPPLGTFYKKEKPYYIEVNEVIETELEPIYEAIFIQANKLLKPNGRICMIAPIFSIIDGKDVQINVEKLANRNNFKLIPIIKEKRIINKSNQKLQFRKPNVRTLIDAKKGQIIKRKIYIFEKKN